MYREGRCAEYRGPHTVHRTTAAQPHTAAPASEAPERRGSMLGSMPTAKHGTSLPLDAATESNLSLVQKVSCSRYCCRRGSHATRHEMGGRGKPNRAEAPTALLADKTPYQYEMIQGG